MTMNDITIQEFGNDEEIPGKIGHIKYRLSKQLSGDEAISVSSRKLPGALNSTILDIIKICPDTNKKTVKVVACNIGFEFLMTAPTLIEYSRQRKLLQESKIGNTDKFILFQNQYSEFRLKNWENPGGPRKIEILKEDLEKLDSIELNLGFMRSDITVIALEIGLKTILDYLGIPRSRVYEMLHEDIIEFMKDIERQIVVLWVTFREFEIDTVIRSIIFRDLDTNNAAEINADVNSI